MFLGDNISMHASGLILPVMAMTVAFKYKCELVHMGLPLQIILS